MGLNNLTLLGEISTRTSPIVNVRVRIRIRFRVWIRFRVRVKDRVMVGMVLGLGCGSLHKYIGGVRAEILIYFCSYAII